MISDSDEASLVTMASGDMSLSQRLVDICDNLVKAESICGFIFLAAVISERDELFFTHTHTHTQLSCVFEESLIKPFCTLEGN